MTAENLVLRRTDPRLVRKAGDGRRWGCSSGQLLVLGPAAWTPPLRNTVTLLVFGKSQTPTVLGADERVVGLSAGRQRVAVHASAPIVRGLFHRTQAGFACVAYGRTTPRHQNLIPSAFLVESRVPPRTSPGRRRLPRETHTNHTHLRWRIPSPNGSPSRTNRARAVPQQRARAALPWLPSSRILVDCLVPSSRSTAALTRAVGA